MKWFHRHRYHPTYTYREEHHNWGKTLIPVYQCRCGDTNT